MLQETAASK
jgi:hypothetical protein